MERVIIQAHPGFQIAGMQRIYENEVSVWSEPIIAWVINEDRSPLPIGMFSGEYRHDDYDAVIFPDGSIEMQYPAGMKLNNVDELREVYNIKVECEKGK